MKSLVKKLSLTLTLLLLSFAVAMADVDSSSHPSNADNAGTKPTYGDGTKDNPYQIVSYDNLVWFADEVALNKQTSICAKLMANIEYNETYKWYGIGDVEVAFLGEFEGNKHTISGLTKSYDKDIPFGLIVNMGSSGVVKNLILKDCDFSAPSTKGLGVVCGKSYGGTISHCAVINCSLTNTAINGVTGMICGNISSGEITHCFSTINNLEATNASNFGTIAGVGNTLKLERCVSKARENLNNPPLVGSSTSVSSNYCEGNVSAERFASGEMTWVLSDDEDENQKIWRQNLKEFHPEEEKSDELPVFTDDHEEVYRYGEENKSLEKGKFTTCWYLRPITLNNVTAYIAKGVNQNNVTLEQVNSTEKNIPYVLYSETGGTYTMPICYFNKKAFFEEKRVDNNLMVGQVKGQDIVRKEDCVRYVLQTQNGVQALYRVGATKVTAANFKCYMEQKVTPQANDEARTSLGFSFGEPTGIDEIRDNQGQIGQPVNIMGQRVGNATRGIYIINGKKFLAR